MPNRCPQAGALSLLRLPALPVAVARCFPGEGAHRAVGGVQLSATEPLIALLFSHSGYVREAEAAVCWSLHAAAWLSGTLGVLSPACILAIN